MKLNEIQSVAETAEGVYLMFIVDDDGDSASAVGHVYWTSGRREDEDPPKQILATSDTLRAMWASPTGSLWVGSADGNMGTTARVGWTRPPNGAEYKTLANSAHWSATALPTLKPSGLPPNIGVVWGIDDRDVYASAYGGHIFHWDGSEWTQVHEGPGNGHANIRAFGGIRPDDIYAVGADRTLLHFDGSRWSALAVPPPQAKRENFSGVYSLKTGETFVCSSLGSEEGRVIHGTAAGFAELTRCKMPLISMAVLGDRLLFATGNGVAELIDRRVQMIKSGFDTVAMFPGLGRVFVTKPAPKEPWVGEFDPRHPDEPWWAAAF